MASNIPRFTSFRPKPKPPVEESNERDQSLKATVSDVSYPSKTRSRREKIDVRSKHRNDKTTERRLPTHGEEAGREEKASNSRKERSHIRDGEPSKLFFSDRRGDPDIIRYGGLNRYDIPAYRSYGYGCVIGLSPDMKIDRDRSTDKEIIIIPARRRRQERLLASRHTKRDGQRNVRFLKAAQETHDIGADFIPVMTRKRKYEDNEGVGPEEDFRGFRDETMASKPSDPDAEYESDVVVSSVDAEVARSNAELVRRTHEHPEDVDGWLELARHQEAMVSIDRSSHGLSASDKQHLADVRISTYEQALKKVHRTADNAIPLYSALMREAQRAWEVAKQSIKWAEILGVFPRDEGLWVQYLNFVQSCFTDFKYENCRMVFFRCLHTVRTTSSQTPSKFLVYVLVRLTSMIRQAGYQELAIAAWQALLEFHLLRPGNVNEGKLLSSFEEFWESEESRIGEENTKGWRAFDVDDASRPSNDAEPLHTRDPSDSPLRDFRRRELDSIRKLQYPGRTMDEIGEDDAFHTVLYSDIEGFLRILPQDISNSALLHGFLRFCGLPGLLGTSPDSSRWLDDQFLMNNVQKPSQRTEDHQLLQSIKRYSDCPFYSFQMTAESLVDQCFPESIDNFGTGFVRRVLKLLLVDDTSEDRIGEYLLAFESKYFPAEAFKTAKKLLKTRPSSLRLYNVYGLIEARSGNSVKADQVFSAALSMQKSGSLLSTSSALDLFANWTWAALRRGDSKEALWRLVSPTGQVTKISSTQEEPDQGAHLRARSALSDLSDRALIESNYIVAVKATSLLALMNYLSHGNDPTTALAVHRTLSEWFKQRKLSKTLAAELHAQSLARLITYHATHAPIIKPAFVRTNLEPLIANFPNNTILLSLYAANESRFSIDDRVRAIMHQNTLSDSNRTIVGWTFAIHYETLRGEIAGSTSHSIRALYKKAEDDVGAHCPALWKQHVEFEFEQARNEREKRPAKKPRRDGKKRKGESMVEEAYRRVKETFFKGMTQLPWCKDYMMMAFTHLGEEFLSEEELRKVYNVMVEKELRLYVELEDEA